MLAALPMLWWVGWTSLAVLGNERRLAAVVIRSLVWSLIVVALAGIQLVWVNDRLTVMYVLDQSESIPESKRTAMLDFVIQNVRDHRNAPREDRAGIIVFGRDASIEIPPFDDDVPPLRRLESLLDRTDATNLEAALNLAQASMPEDTARRVVIVTDGNENMGAARAMARRLVQSGVGIDVVPVETEAASEVLVEKIDLPTDIRKGQPFEARIVVDHQLYAKDGSSAEPVTGRLRVKQKVAARESLLLEQTIALDPGKNVFPLRHTIEEPGAYTYSAEFVPDSDASDSISQNNAASGYTYVRGKGRVLLIHTKDQADSYAKLMETLRDADIEVTPMANDQLFGSIAELQAYDAIILAGVPRVSGDNAQTIVSFTDEQIEMLVRNTQQLGAGLLMIGGPESLGAGGWTGTEIEKAMPVDFQIKNTKVRAVGALALIMHASEMAQGNYWQKVIARKAIEQMGPVDYAGVLHWTMRGDAWMWGGKNGLLPVGPNRKAMLAALGRMTPGDMPQFDPAMKMAVAGLTRTPASVKHCIIISDGDPSAPAGSTISAFKTNNITISTVAVESHGLSDSQRLQRIASATGGKYYSVKSGRALPEIFQREARRVSRPLVYEPSGGTAPEVIFPHPVVDGIEPVLPPVRGFVLTQTKDSPLAQVVLQSPMPKSPENATILATWNYGLGRSAVLTTDSGERWAAEWREWPGYEKLHSQLVRWLMRPTGDTGQFTLATKVRDGQVEVVVGALDQDDAFLNFLEVTGSVLDPDLNPLPLRMRQSAPGRYTGTFSVEQAGTYFINVLPGDGNAPLSAGVTIPYSDEFRFRETNLALLKQLAALQPPSGEAGEVTEPLESRLGDAILSRNPFRGGVPPARSIRDAWPWFVLVGCVLFFLDVLVRRVAIGFGFARRWIQKMKGQQVAPEHVARLDQLREQKAAARKSLDQRRANVRFEPDQTELVKGDSVAGSDGGSPSAIPEPPPSKTDAPEPSVSYTERLLEAKRRARDK
ncbi:MAG: VWA domain-containing protein [Planctomycetota bacterium]